MPVPAWIAVVAGREVVVAGRLSALSRAEAFERVAAAGGTLELAPGANALDVGRGP